MRDRRISADRRYHQIELMRWLDDGGRTSPRVHVARGQYRAFDPYVDLAAVAKLKSERNRWAYIDELIAWWVAAEDRARGFTDVSRRP